MNTGVSDRKSCAWLLSYVEANIGQHAIYNPKREGKGSVLCFVERWADGKQHIHSYSLYLKTVR